MPVKKVAHEIPVQTHQKTPVVQETQETSKVYAAKLYAAKPSVPSPYTDWEAVTTAYAKVNPSVTAILEQIQCESFSAKKIILALDAHQAKFLRVKDREAFQVWLGYDVVWEKKVTESKTESVSDIRQRRQQSAQQQRWQEAEKDTAVQRLVKNMDARLVDVQAAPSTNE